MEFLKRSGKPFRPSHAVFALAALAALLLAACGPQVIKGRPPFISISDMHLEGDSLNTGFDISNQNGIPMTVDSVDIVVKIHTTELVRYTSQDRLEISANGTEEVSARHEPDDFTRNLLNSLDDGRLNSLAFDLEGSVMTAEDGKLRSEHTGHLYPVPGKPGYYRAAVTQARELIREDF